MVEVSNEIRRAIATGNVVIGADRSFKVLKRGHAKLVIVASNCKPDVLADLEHYAKLANVPIHVFEGGGGELGLACGKPFLINMLAVVDSGDSNILNLGTRR